MRTNLFKDKITIKQKTATQTAMGQIVVWAPVQTRYGRVIPLNAQARAQYQQMNSVVTHRIEFEKGVPLTLADYRFLHLDKTYEPVEPAQTIGNNTVVVVKEI